jgi:hypothetical protein
MPTVFLCPTFGVGYQGFTAGGLPLNAGKLYTYIAGGTTPQATYTTSAGSVQNANPIILDADGRTPNEVWLIAGQTYRIDVKDSADNLLASYDNIDGINDLYGQQIIFPATYGVVGNGVTDDTAAWNLFMAALGVGNVGVVPSGWQIRYNNSAGRKTYDALEDISIIFGANAGMLFTTNTEGGFYFTNGNNINLDNMQFDYVTPPTGARVGTSTHALTFYNCDNVKVTKPIVLASPNMGIVFNTCTNVICDHPYIYGVLADGIHFVDTQYFRCINPLTINTGDDGVATHRTVAGALTTTPGVVIGHICKNSGNHGYNCGGGVDVIYDDYNINNTYAEGIVVFHDTVSLLAVPNRVEVGDGMIYNAGQYNYAPSGGTPAGSAIGILGGDAANEITIGYFSAYNSNGHGVYIDTATGSSYPGVVNLENFVIDGTDAISGGPGRGIYAAKVGTLNLASRGIVRNADGAGFYTVAFDKIVGDIPDIDNPNRGASTDANNIVFIKNTTVTGLDGFICANGGNLIETDSPVSGQSNTITIDDNVTGSINGFRTLYTDGYTGGLIITNTADSPEDILVTIDQGWLNTHPINLSLTNGSSTALSAVNTFHLNTGIAIAAATLTLPTVTDEGHRVVFATSNTITALTLNKDAGDTLLNAPTTLTGGTSFEYYYSKASTTWIRLR